MLCLLLAAVLAGCATGAVDVGLPERQRAWLENPVDDFPLGLPTAVRLDLQTAFRSLVEQGDVDAARVTAERLLERDPELVPALVLRAQADWIEGDCEAVVESLGGRLEELPDYRAGQLMLGLCAEAQGQPVVAYQAFRSVADVDPRAARRAEQLEPEAVAQAFDRFDRALAAARLDEAVEWLALLQTWRPDTVETVEAIGRLAAASGDEERELEVVRALMERGVDQREIVERRAELEVRHGEARTGVDLYRDLSTRYPEDASLAERLEMATFRWRLERVPPYAAAVFGRPEISRADFATLLFWTVPSLRSAQSEAGQIASDVLEHPRREEIVRVLNLGVMDVADPALRSFDPDRPLTRGEAVASLLRLARVLGEPACLAQAPPAFGRSATCEYGVRCGLLADIDSCLPSTAVSGEEALEGIRRILALSGG